MESVVGERGQITIPKKIRDKLKIFPGDIISFEIDGELIKLKKKDPISELKNMGEGIFRDGVSYVNKLRKDWETRER